MKIRKKSHKTGISKKAARYKKLFGFAGSVVRNRHRIGKLLYGLLYLFTNGGSEKILFRKSTPHS